MMINIQVGDIDKVKKDHLEGLKTWVLNKIKSRETSPKKPRKRKLNKIRYKLLKSMLNEDIDSILIGDADSLKALNQKYINEFSKTQVELDKYTKDITAIFSYSLFKKQTTYNSLSLSKSLGVPVCPYCNRNYTSTFVSNQTKKSIVPTFDHYYPQIHYPLLGLSLYNLIPSCNLCNSASYKGSKCPERHDIHFPYDTFKYVKGFKFKHQPTLYSAYFGTRKDFKLLIAKIDPITNDRFNKIKASLEFFSIPEIYEKCHGDLVGEIVEKSTKYSKSYFKSLKAAYGHSLEKTFNTLYETHYDDSKLGERPFSKLKKDMFDQFGRVI